MENMENRYLDRLSDLYPTIAAASTEIINLQAILNLPKYHIKKNITFELLSQYMISFSQSFK